MAAFTRLKLSHLLVIETGLLLVVLLALGEVSRNSYVLYDPDMVQCCLRPFRKRGYRFP